MWLQNPVPFSEQMTYIWVMCRQNVEQRPSYKEPEDFLKIHTLYPSSNVTCRKDGMCTICNMSGQNRKCQQNSV